MARPQTQDRPPPTGLYGSSPGLNLVAESVAELVGTFLFVLAVLATSTAAALGVTSAGGAYGASAVPLVSGLALAAMAIAFGHVSGAHINPAVTVALALTRRFPWRCVGPYVAAELTGGVLAALVTWWLFGSAGRTVAHLGATSPTKDASGLRVLAVEAVVTFLLMTVVMAATTDARAPRSVAPLAVGFALTAATFVAAPLTGAGVNPARALGPMLVSWTMTGWWAYVIGPVLGATLAALLYDRFIGQATAPD